MGTKIKVGRIKPKPEKTFGVKKPFTGKDKNRKGSKKVTAPRLKPKVAKAESRNPLVLREFYVYMRDLANSRGCDAHHWMPKSKLKQDIFLVFVPYDKHRAIHAEGNSQSPWEWAEAQGFDVLVKRSMRHFEAWVYENDLPEEYFELIEQLRTDPFNCHDIARDFILNNRSL
jgi:hypothetical protein